jgi:preprotein translocase subunit SecD
LVCAPDACPHPGGKHVYVLGAPKLTSKEIERESVHAALDPQTGAWVVVLQFTPSGERRFNELTRALAHRGRELAAPQHLLLVVNETVRSAPYIDYMRNPDGFSGELGIQFNAGSPKEARKLAKALRRD